MTLHPHLAALVGTWRGEGHGEYPTISSFDYADEMVFTDIGKPFVHFVERTTIGDEPRHTETGFWRFTSDGALETVIAIPTGQAEVGVGSVSVEGEALVFTTDAVGVRNTPSAKRVDRIVRKLTLTPGELRHELFMEAVGEVLLLHLDSRLRR